MEATWSFSVQIGPLWADYGRSLSKQDLFTAVIVFLYLIIVHVVCAACLMKESSIAPGRVAEKNRCLLCLILDRGFNAGICSYLLGKEA